MKYLFHIFIPIIIAIIVNSIIYSSGVNIDSNKDNIKMLPPGYVIAIIWIIILGLLGYANYLVRNSFASFIIIIAIVYCLLYPFLTNKYKKLNISNKTFDSLALAIAILVCFMCYLQDSKTIYYTLPFVIWTLYVNIALYY